MFKKVLIGLLLLVLVGGGLFLLRLIDEAEKSQKMEMSFMPPEEGQLKACGEAPNCVSSSSPREGKHFVAPFDSPNQDAWEKLIEKLPDSGLELKLRSGNYVHLTSTSEIFEFIDDIELFYDTEGRLIQFRSASRVGYSDMGANRARYEQIRDIFSSIQ